MEIPNNYIEFCKEVAQIARKYELINFHGEFRPCLHDKWQDTIEFSWEQGRHGAESGEVNITSHVFVHTNIEASR